MGLLDGMRVLDASVWRPLPHGTQILADLGAEVLKIEPPGGDPMRAYPELFASVARGKRSVELDLRSDDGRARAHELVLDADVFCEGWRPGVADRLGLGRETVRGINPSIITCSLSGYGQDGPWRDVPGHDINYQALAGALAPRDGATPGVPRLPVADLEAGTMCALLICAAWARRQVTGEGEHIDVAMADVVAWWVGPHDAAVVAGESGRRTSSPGYGVFGTRDGGWIALGVLGEQRLWDAIATGLELHRFVGVSYAQRLELADEVDAALRRAIGGRDRDELTATLRAAGAPVSPLLSPEEATVHEQLVARALVDSTAGDARRLPALLERHPRRAHGAVPDVGMHPDGFATAPPT